MHTPVGCNKTYRFEREQDIESPGCCGQAHDPADCALGSTCAAPHLGTIPSPGSHGQSISSSVWTLLQYMPSLLLLPRLDSGLHEILTCQQFTGLTPFGSYVQLTDQRDAFLWSLRQNDQFTVRSIAHCLAAWIAQKNMIWKLKLPLRFLSDICKKE